MSSKSYIAIFILAASTGLAGCGVMNEAHEVMTANGTENSWNMNRNAGQNALKLKDYGVAQHAFESAAADARNPEVRNPHHLTETLSELALVYQLQNKPKEAEKTYQEMIAVGEKMQAGKSPSELYKRVGRNTVAKAWLQLGKLYTAQKDYPAAENAYEQGLKVKTMRSGMYPIIAEIERSYATLLDTEHKNPQLAQKLREQASSVTDQILDGL